MLIQDGNITRVGRGESGDAVPGKRGRLGRCVPGHTVTALRIGSAGEFRAAMRAPGDDLDQDTRQRLAGVGSSYHTLHGPGRGEGVLEVGLERLDVEGPQVSTRFVLRGDVQFLLGEV